jgi:DUF4097 and DUF4098 domain-containing protein YvlB
MSKSLFRLTAAVCLSLLAAGAAAAQDFTRTYQLGAGSSISVHNISGNVRVTGYDGQTIIVNGFKEGRDRELVEIEDRSSGSRVDVRVRYPEECRCDASVRFEVQVPRALSYRFDSISSVSGDVNVSSVSGELRAKSVSGEVTVSNITGTVNASSVSGSVEVGNVAGTVSAKSTSGNVEVEITKLEGTGNLEFASVSGHVRVTLPGTLDAEVEMSSFSGSLRMDFPLRIEERDYGPGRRAHGQIGNGTRRLRLSSTSGSVSLLRN